MKGSSKESKTIDISADNIGLPSPKSRNAPSSLFHQNRYFRKQNEALKRELQQISVRLDGEIKKRISSNKKRAWSKDEDVTYMQLQNAYKKCEIYKKEVNFYRKRLSSIQDDSKYEEFDTKLTECLKENIDLKNQIKSLKKLIKLQEKGLIDMGTEEYAKISKENEQLREENRRLKKYLSQYRLASLKSRQSTRTEEAPDKRQKVEDSAGDDPNSVRQKLEKSYQKIKTLNGEVTHLRDLLENYKFQIQEKDKEISTLRQRIGNLRKNNDELLSQRNLKKSVNLDKASRQSKDYGGSKRGSGSRAKYFKTDPQQAHSGSRSIIYPVYPVKLEQGVSSAAAVKWNDEAFNSKIKEVQVVIDENGDIKDLHARYQKGQSKKYSQANPKLKSSVLTCSDQQYIISMSGVFAKKCLKFLTLKTSNKRGQSFGVQVEANHQSLTFDFMPKELESIGALFGQRSEQGITKIGCFINKA